MDPWLFIIVPLLIIFVTLQACKWAEAYDKYKTFDDPFELIMMTILSLLGYSIGYGIYKLAF
jgi:hypothetical protein